MVFQSYALFPHLTVRENIVFGLKVRGIARQERRQRLQEAAAMVGLLDLLERKPAQLSGGQRQRVALARTIVARQPVCLMDEPLSNLDAKLRAEMRYEIRGLQQKLGLTMLYVTHDQTEAMTMADQVVLMRSGQIEQLGTPLQLYDTPATSFAARFIGLPPMNLIQLDQVAEYPDLLPDTSTLESNHSGKSCRLGIRPEDVQLYEGGIPSRVESVDYLGSETIIRLKMLEETVVAKVQGRCEVEKGDAYPVAWNREQVHIFDENGMRWEA
jgi:sn-glycerol 3-phosphate transport system ATP-binding protein